MPYTVTGKNVQLDHLGTVTGFVSLHTADPGETGLNEVTGGSPAYARKAITWAAASAAVDGEMAASNQPLFDVPAGTTVTHVGFWTLASGGDFHASGAITSAVFAAQGTLTLTSTNLHLNN